ncbi:bestrophin-like domain [Hymenobacter yonginensis]|uniref:DUF4239 domain-containing protein n=1 Tax=Hymenobacter yonginensis TaxID=748197 RepID=A0ABY7PR69_9BACT|nr:hypothetical protein [Hymenobacter yonginensis]WBO85335.1 hypothetical protein O9Z63_03620 [Hymenobacter yonginensis]
MRYSTFEVLWFVLAYPASLLLAVAVGYLFAEVYYRRRQRIWKPSGIESALITVFGLLLSFTLLSSNNSLKERTGLIHQTSDAIAELYRESQLLPAPERAAVQQFLLQLLQLELNEHRPRRPHDPAHIRRLERLDHQFWQQLSAAGRTSPARADRVRRLLPAFNKLDSNTFRLHYSYREGTPYSILSLLFVSSWAIGILVGFTNSAQETRHYFVPILFVVISVLTIQSIRDLDNPELGFIRPDYGNLQDLQRIISRSQPPALQP